VLFNSGRWLGWLGRQERRKGIIAPHPEGKYQNENAQRQGAFNRTCASSNQYPLKRGPCVLSKNRVSLAPLVKVAVKSITERVKKPAEHVCEPTCSAQP
jgi:hypothetical protein